MPKQKNPKGESREKKTTDSERSSKIPNVEPGFPGGPGDNGGKPEAKARTEPELEPYSYVDQETCKIIASLIPFGILAIISGNENFNLKDNEIESLAPAWDKVIAKYLPIAAAEFEPEISLAAQISILLIGKSGIFGEPKEETEEPAETKYVPVKPEGY